MTRKNQVRPEWLLIVALLLWFALHLWSGGRWIAQNFCTTYVDQWSVLLSAAYLGTVIVLDWVLFCVKNAVATWMLFVYWLGCTLVLAVILLSGDNPFPLLLVLFTPYTPLGAFGNLLEWKNVSADLCYTVVPLALSAAQVVCCGASGWHIQRQTGELDHEGPSEP